MDFKIGQLVLILSLIISQTHGDILKCEDEGCYEVIKTFVKLLEDKINETDKVREKYENNFCSQTKCN